ncbi:MAG: hypothetical protein PHR36_01220 [Patescibacteria group bacterium]|nr:hypothetical protein [Patescibacteria group bacterium]
MTVVISQHFFQGVVVIADSRSSKQENGVIIPWKDNTQKIFFLTPNLIISFSGDVEFAGTIISFIAEQIKIRPKLGLLNIFIGKGPKLIKYAYNKLVEEKGIHSISFIIAGIDFSRPDQVKDEKGNVVGHVGIYDKKIFIVSSPSFNPRFASVTNPFVIMGSGKLGIEGLEEDFKKMQFGQVLPLDYHAILMEIALRGKIRSLGISTVGGLSQIAIIDNRGPHFLPYKGKRDPSAPGGLDVEMLVKDGRFIQKDLKTGKEVILLYPPEVINIKEDKSDLFAEIELI